MIKKKILNAEGNIAVKNELKKFKLIAIKLPIIRFKKKLYHQAMY